MTSFERETVEFQPVTVTLNGTPVTTGVKFAIAVPGARPATFSAPATLAGEIGVMVQGLAPGGYYIWAQITSSPETPVIRCGYINIK
jgi:hypothetical protein